MKKILFRSVALVMFMMFVLPTAGQCRQKDDGNLYGKLSQMKAVNVYLADITDSTNGQNKVDGAAFKKTLEDALVTRMTLNFKPVTRKEDADIVITANVTEYIWMLPDPIDEIGGLETAAWDAANSEHYIRLYATFSVLDAKTGDVLWTKDIKGTVTDKNMTEQEGIEMVDDRIVKMFIRDCFSKKKSQKQTTLNM